MKILQVNKFFDPRGGADIYMQQLILKQQERGHEVHAFSTRSPNNVPSPDADRFVHRFDLAQSHGVLEDTRKAIAFVWNQGAQHAMERAIEELKPDIIHLHNIYHHLSTSILEPIRRLKIPCVQTLHDYKLACPNYKMFTQGSVCERCKGGKYLEAVKHECLFPGMAGNLLAAFEMGMTKSAQSYERTVKMFIPSSHFLSKKMIEWGEPAEKMHVIPNPVDLPATAAARDGGYLLAAGRLAVEKGFDTLVRAAERVPGIRLKIAGIGPEEPILKRLAQDAPHIEFLGFVRHDELAEIRRRAMACIVPSVWYENAPLAVMEALADGLPIIASRIGGLPELVEDGVNGILVDPGNVDQLATALQRFVGGEDFSAMAAASRARAENYTWDRHLDALEALYTRVRS